MQTQKYSVNQHPIETILSWVKSGEIAIPHDIIDLDVASYEDFLQRRRQLMAAKIREYYYSL